VETGVQGIFNCLKELDSGFRRNDDLWSFSTFYDFIIFGFGICFTCLGEAPPPEALRRAGASAQAGILKFGFRVFPGVPVIGGQKKTGHG
jgi:hypothetical protein